MNRHTRLLTNVELSHVMDLNKDSGRITAIKLIRDLTGLQLKESKEANDCIRDAMITLRIIES